MDKAQHNERPTEVYVWVLRKEEASARALGAIEEPHPFTKLRFGWVPRTFALCVVQNFNIRRSGLSVIKLISQIKRDDWTKWTDEASGVYKCTRALLRRERVQGRVLMRNPI